MPCCCKRCDGCIKSGGTYGSPRIHKESRKKVGGSGRCGSRRCAGMTSVVSIQARKSTASILAYDRNFKAEHPNQKWLADMIQGRRLAAFGSGHGSVSRKIVGWSMAQKAQSSGARRAKDGHCLRKPAGALSDLGSQLPTVPALLTNHGIICSMSAAGSCYDNARALRYLEGCARETNMINEARLDYSDTSKSGTIAVAGIPLALSPPHGGEDQNPEASGKGSAFPGIQIKPRTLATNEVSSHYLLGTTESAEEMD